MAGMQLSGPPDTLLLMVPCAAPYIASGELFSDLAPKPPNPDKELHLATPVCAFEHSMRTTNGNTNPAGNVICKLLFNTVKDYPGTPVATFYLVDAINAPSHTGRFYKLAVTTLNYIRSIKLVANMTLLSMHKVTGGTGKAGRNQPALGTNRNNGNTSSAKLPPRIRPPTSPTDGAGPVVIAPVVRNFATVNNLEPVAQCLNPPFVESACHSRSLAPATSPTSRTDEGPHVSPLGTPRIIDIPYASDVQSRYHTLEIFCAWATLPARPVHSARPICVKVTLYRHTIDIHLDSSRSPWTFALMTPLTWSVTQTPW
ncbi:hypothetical protein BDK51DRAFT_25651 [Blyttiomyces helicus]|uniref:Uncharacterized protein n=1 Tax=Blyttiomyces helicus TaxID=388810 RepID=A0A4P9WFQ6_9FUNG|nr:hypothetical protein BDK51DRAFT_25651 [Blyttiomyces helicus]|eukprot:RKO91611.1 hypothetical protein BDK51DRAFT_25651 [Blyttiomyces helicus]